MISDIGIDMIEVDRVATKTLCSTVCCKRSFFKALGIGWIEGTSYNKVEITNDEAGKHFTNKQQRRPVEL